MKFLQLIIPVSLLFLISCKPQKQTNDSTSNAPQTNTAVHEPATAGEIQTTVKPDQETLTKKDTPYRLIVSFISIGEGTDRNAKEIFDSFLNEWKANQNKEIKYETVRWGREGEVDYCFPISELNETEQKQFVSGIREKFKGHDLIQFAENEPCRHKR